MKINHITRKEALDILDLDSQVSLELFFAGMGIIDDNGDPNEWTLVSSERYNKPIIEFIPNTDKQEWIISEQLVRGLKNRTEPYKGNLLKFFRNIINRIVEIDSLDLPPPTQEELQECINANDKFWENVKQEEFIFESPKIESPPIRIEYNYDELSEVLHVCDITGELVWNDDHSIINIRGKSASQAKSHYVTVKNKKYNKMVVIALLKEKSSGYSKSTSNDLRLNKWNLYVDESLPPVLKYNYYNLNGFFDTITTDTNRISILKGLQGYTTSVDHCKRRKAAESIFQLMDA